MDASDQKSVERFSGINNVDEAYRLFPQIIDRRWNVFPLREANNVLIDNTYALKSRLGFGTAVLTGSNIHSLWSDGVRCFFVDGTTLYEMDAAYNKKVIMTVTSGYRMSFAPVNDRYYFTNEREIGYIRGAVNYPCMNPSREFKLPLPAGSHIEYFMGCLFVSVKNVLYISDPLCDYYDTRNGYRVFADNITMIRAVDNGLYISDKKVWFIRGKGNAEFQRVEVEAEPAIPFTDLRTSADSMGYGVSGDVAVWTSKGGIVIGDSGGTVKDVTSDRYHMADHGQGTAFVRDDNNVKHYINNLY
jgi:hypothetical protein